MDLLSVPRPRPRADWRVHFGIAAVGSVLALALIAWIVSSAVQQNERMQADFEAIRHSWTGAELVRICARGDRVYRLNGRLVTGAHGWSVPLQFAADVTPEAACVH